MTIRPKPALPKNRKLSQEPGPPVRSRWGISIGITAALLIVTALAAWLAYGTGSQGKKLLAKAYASYSEGDAAAAEHQAWQAWMHDPELNEAALLASEMAYGQQRFTAAAEYAAKVTNADPRLKLTALKLLALVYHRKLRQFTAAEETYRAALVLAPDDPESNSGLAQLFGLCGRRAEAVPLVLTLIRQGHASDLLMLLAREETVVNDLDALEEARGASPNDPLPLVGLAWHAAEKGRSDEAVEMLHKALALDHDLVCAHVALAKRYAEYELFAELSSWQADMQRRTKLAEVLATYADVWVARGRLAEHRQDLSGAVRCYAEAAQRSPDSKVANARLAQLLAQLDNSAAADNFKKYAEGLQVLRDAQDRVFFSNEENGITELLELIKGYEKLGRFFEAYGWCHVGLNIESTNSQVEDLRRQLQLKLQDAPLQLVAPSMMPSSSLDLTRYPLPAVVATPPSASIARAASQSITDFAFRDDAQRTGLDFSFINGTVGEPERKMYEFTGGGMAALDFDGDSWPDIALSQGGIWPTGTRDSTDKLFRNIAGERFEEVTCFRLLEDGFGQGISAGDYNSDGFPDLYIAQIGQNRLMHNNGDGTFTDQTAESQVSEFAWTTSCVIADLDGDALPDIYDVNYVEGEDVFQRICKDDAGNPVMCLPGDFASAQDRLWINNGDGTFRDGTSSNLSQLPTGKGLGVVTLDVEGSGRLSLFVANDTTPNFLFVPTAKEGSPLVLSEQGVASGLAFDANGKSKGCMGVAVGDVNNDGQMDLVITNFYNEASTLYINGGEYLFSDQTRAWGLHQPSLRVLGFGAQFIDADLDGSPELFVANGHIDDLRDKNIPYQMEPQLFTVRDGRFSLQPASDSRPYFQRSLLGRAAVKLDWNSDGRQDLLVGHLNSNYALLTNVSQPTGNHLSIRLVGTKSSRDAIGTTVEIHFGDRRSTGQLTAGDGYQASNQRHLMFGLGDHNRAQRVRVHWPSGKWQELRDVEANSELLVVEER